MPIDAVYDPKATTIPVLRYLVAVADHRHFGRAAEAASISQPTLSALISRWERSMRVRVFERDQHGVRVTPAGERIVAAARAALEALRAVEAAAAEAKPPFFGPVRLGVIPTVGPYALPFICPALERAFPGLELPIREAPTGELLAGLDAGRIDVAILAALPAMAGRYATERLYREPFLVALPRANRLAARSELCGDDLAGERLLLLDDGHCLRDQALAVCNRRAEQTGGADYRATSLETLRQLVAAGAGVTILPALAGPGEDSPRLVVRPMTGEGAERTIVLAWRQSDPRAEAYRSLAVPIRRMVPEGVSR